jgi:hypothetical protein
MSPLALTLLLLLLTGCTTLSRLAAAPDLPWDCGEPATAAADPHHGEGPGDTGQGVP